MNYIRNKKRFINKIRIDNKNSNLISQGGDFYNRFTH